MSLLYDPVSREPKKWVMGTVISIPILLVILFLLSVSNAVKNKTIIIEAQETDIFAKDQ